MHSPRHARGFSLIEALIVMVLLIGAATITIGILGAQQKTQQRQALVYEQAAEMSKITTAVESYLSTAEGLPDDEDTIFAISLSDVIAAGLLPADFASRPASGTTAPVSPMGQLYSVTAVLTADGYRALVIPTGTPNAGFMARAGVPNTEAAIREYSAAVMQRMRQEYNRVASVITKDTKSVDSAVTGFSYDLSTFLAAAPNMPTVVGMANFDDLETVATGGGGDAGGANKQCRFTVDQECSTGTTEEWSYTTCEKWGEDHLELAGTDIVRTVGGDVSILRAFNIGSSNQSTRLNEEGSGNYPFRSLNGQLPVRFTKAVGVANWGNPRSDSTRTSIQSTSRCTNQLAEFKPYTLTCSATGAVLKTWYEPVCGQWYDWQPANGDSCSPGGYMFSNDAMYQGGMNDDLRGLEVVGVNAPVVPSTNTYNNVPYIETIKGSEPIVRTLSSCPGSVNTVPIKVRKKDLGDGTWFEYLDLPSRNWFDEKITFEGTGEVVRARCEVIGATLVSGNMDGQEPSTNVTNNCPNKIIKTADGGTVNVKGWERYRVRYPASAATHKVRMCCS